MKLAVPLLFVLVACSSPSETVLDAGALDEGRADAGAAILDAGMDAHAQQDLGLDEGVVEHDSGPDMSADDAAVMASDAEVDASLDAGLSPTALCPVASMTDIYSGFFPSNPYGAQPAAGACIAAAHDVIVVLGCPNNDDGSPAECQIARANIAFALSAAGYGDRFITSGAAAHNPYVEADTLAALLMERGVPSDHIFRDTLALHTDENIYYSSHIMLEHGWTTAVIVSEDPGHLINSAVCDSNCCVNLGRLTVLEFPVGDDTQVAAHYVLIPPGTAVTSAECDQIQLPLKLMCTNLSSRHACAGDLML